MTPLSIYPHYQFMLRLSDNCPAERTPSAIRSGYKSQQQNTLLQAILTAMVDLVFGRGVTDIVRDTAVF